MRSDLWFDFLTSIIYRKSAHKCKFMQTTQTSFLHFLGFEAYLSAERHKTRPVVCFQTYPQGILACKSISSICSSPLLVSMSQAKGELRKSNCPSTALKSENRLINSCCKVIKWELYLSSKHDNACVTACNFN